MMLAQAVLVAGPKHADYAVGTSLTAIMFVKVQTDDDMDTVASRELAELGWAAMTIERYEYITDLEQFEGKDTPEADAYRDAVETGFGIVVFPEPGSTRHFVQA